MKNLNILNGRYAISESGKVYSLSYKNSGITKEVKSFLSKDGYRRITLYVSSTKKKTFLIHRLVASVYIKNPMNLPVAHHIDEDKLNNHFSNLQWVTKRDNTLYSSHLWSGDKHGRSKMTNAQVLEIRKCFESGQSRKVISSNYDISYSHVCKIVKGTTHKTTK